MVTAEHKFGMMYISKLEPTRMGMMSSKYNNVVSINYKIIDFTGRGYYIHNYYNNNTVLLKITTNKQIVNLCLNNSSLDDKNIWRKC